MPPEPQPRVIDDTLTEAIARLPVVLLNGARGVGKTTSASRHAATIYDLKDDDALDLIKSNPKVIATASPPVLIDEWHVYPKVMDVVRTDIDRDPTPGRYILTSTPSAPIPPDVHSGIGRPIIGIDMRPFSLFERGLDVPCVSLAELLAGDMGDIAGATSVGRGDYIEQIVISGLPGHFGAPTNLRAKLMRTYVDLLCRRDIRSAAEGGRQLSAQLTMRWLTSYARGISTEMTFEKLRKFAHREDEKDIAWDTANVYRQALENLGIIEEQPAWSSPFSPVKRTKKEALRHFIDPAIAVAVYEGEWLLEMNDAIQAGQVDVSGSYAGRLFQSLVLQSVRVYASATDASVFWLGTSPGGQRCPAREVDIIVINSLGKVVAIEVKLTDRVTAVHCEHLRWLRDKLGPMWSDGIVVYAGDTAYRREADGIGVVPAALLGP